MEDAERRHPAVFSPVPRCAHGRRQSLCAFSCDDCGDAFEEDASWTPAELIRRGQAWRSQHSSTCRARADAAESPRVAEDGPKWWRSTDNVIQSPIVQKRRESVEGPNHARDEIRARVAEMFPDSTTEYEDDAETVSGETIRADPDLLSPRAPERQPLQAPGSSRISTSCAKDFG